MSEATVSDDYAAIVKALAQCSFLPGSWHSGSWHKRFILDLDGRRYRGDTPPLSFPQRALILSLAEKYRRQLPAEIARLAAQLRVQERAA